MKPILYPGHLSFLILDSGKGMLFVPRLISERRNALGRDCHEAYKVGTNTKEIFFTKYDVPFILGISFVNLHQSTDSCRCISIKGTL